MENEVSQHSEFWEGDPHTQEPMVAVRIVLAEKGFSLD